MREVDGYREYVAGRMTGWRRTAYLLCGNWHTADDMVSIALVKLFRNWKRVASVDQPDAYVRRILVTTVLNERRRPWRREQPTGDLPDRPAAGSVPEDVADRQAIVALLAELPPRRRAVLVLRFFCDLSVEETAAQLGCSPGTVKSQTSRALETLRAGLDGGRLAIEEVWS